jgi:release factor glutamine methyltransferase
VAQIVGARAFWGREFAVTPDTLDPRPETETLVAAALEAPFARLLDLGTGTGCLAVTLLAERGTAAGTATDISPRALAVARVNAERHGVAGRLDLVEADWGAGLVGPFDLVVSNPPYIAAEEMADLAPEVRCHEPWAALTDGADGLTAYRRIAAAAPALLAPGGRLIVEIGPGQAASVEELFAAAGLAVTATRADMDRRERVVTASTA